MEKLIEVISVSKHFNIREDVEGKRFTKKKSILKAVNDVSFDLISGETVGIIGESGSGKTTLGRMLVGLDDYTSGEILYEGKTSKELKSADRLAFHRMCQMVFQNPFDTFDGRYTIEKIMMEPLKLHDIGANDAERREIIHEMFTEGGLVPVEKYLDRYPHELSGGQLQRISILRAMSLKPRFLVADEPVSMLDVSIQKDIIKMLQELTKRYNTSLIFISHDIATTQYISDHIMVMYKGKIVESGASKDVVKNPQHDYTKLLLESVASVDPRKGRRYLEERAANA